jgi:hypothetical protein
MPAPSELGRRPDQQNGFDHGVGHPFFFCTTQKHLTVERAWISMTYGMIPPTPP